MPTSFVLSGKSITLGVDPNMPLLWAIRENTGLHGTKFDRDMTQCGVCTAQPDGTAICPCALLAPTVAGKRVTTTEGIQSKSGKAVQDAWAKLQVSQCSCYQSGQIMLATMLLEQNASLSDADIDATVNGSICRCAACVRTHAAIHKAADILKV